jgi:hypothetical protein
MPARGLQAQGPLGRRKKRTLTFPEDRVLLPAGPVNA